jgi:hypothetical protein
MAAASNGNVARWVVRESSLLRHGSEVVSTTLASLRLAVSPGYSALLH